MAFIKINTFRGHPIRYQEAIRAGRELEKIMSTYSSYQDIAKACGFKSVQNAPA